MSPVDRAAVGDGDAERRCVPDKLAWLDQPMLAYEGNIAAPAQPIWAELLGISTRSFLPTLPPQQPTREAFSRVPAFGGLGARGGTPTSATATGSPGVTRAPCAGRSIDRPPDRRRWTFSRKCAGRKVAGRRRPDPKRPVDAVRG